MYTLMFAHKLSIFIWMSFPKVRVFKSVTFMRQQLRLCWIPIGDWMPVFDVWQFVTNSITLRKNEGNYHLQPSLSHPISQGLLTFSKNPPWMTFLNRNKWHFCYLYSSNKYKKRLIYNAHLKKNRLFFTWYGNSVNKKSLIRLKVPVSD